jgi:hypothetical protein
LANNIIGLISIHRCPVAHICTSCEICSNVPDYDLGRKPKHAESGNGTCTIESDDQSSELVAITNNRGDDDRDNGVEIGRGREEDRLIARESHSGLKDYRKKVG